MGDLGSSVVTTRGTTIPLDYGAHGGVSHKIAGLGCNLVPRIRRDTLQSMDAGTILFSSRGRTGSIASQRSARGAGPEIFRAATLDASPLLMPKPDDDPSTSVVSESTNDEAASLSLCSPRSIRETTEMRPKTTFVLSPKVGSEGRSISPASSAPRHRHSTEIMSLQPTKSILIKRGSLEPAPEDLRSVEIDSPAGSPTHSPMKKKKSLKSIIETRMIDPKLREKESFRSAMTHSSMDAWARKQGLTMTWDRQGAAAAVCDVYEEKPSFRKMMAALKRKFSIKTRRGNSLGSSNEAGDLQSTDCDDTTRQYLTNKAFGANKGFADASTVSVAKWKVVAHISKMKNHRLKLRRERSLRRWENWDTIFEPFLFITCIFWLFRAPFSVFYSNRVYGHDKVTLSLAQLVIWLNLILHTFRPVQTDGKHVGKNSEIRKKYLRTWRFWFELIPCIPFFLLYVFRDTIPLWMTILDFSKCGLFFTGYAALKSMLQRLAFTPPLARIVLAVFSFLVGLHYMTIGFQSVALIEQNDANTQYITFVSGYLKREPHFQYLHAVDWTLKTMSGLSRGNAIPVTDLQHILMLCIVLIGVTCYAILIAFVGEALATPSVQSRHRDHMQQVSDLLKYKQLPDSFKKDVLEYYRYVFKTTGSIGAVTEDPFEDLLPELRAKVQHAISEELLKKVVLFEKAIKNDPLFVRMLVKRLHRKAYVPGANICEQGEIGECMFFLLSGQVEVLNEEDGILAVLGSGSFFGEIALIHATQRTASINARSYCQVLVLYKDDFELVGKYCPESMELIRQAADLRVRAAMGEAGGEAIKRMPWFNKACEDPEFTKLIVSELQSVVVEQDEYICRRGEDGECMYFLINGKVIVFDEIHEDVIAELGEGSFFGEMALLESVPRSATVVAKTNCTLLVLSSAGFKSVCGAFPALHTHMNQKALERMTQGGALLPRLYTETQGDSRTSLEYSTSLSPSHSQKFMSGRTILDDRGKSKPEMDADDSISSGGDTSINTSSNLENLGPGSPAQPVFVQLPSEEEDASAALYQRPLGEPNSGHNSLLRASERVTEEYFTNPGKGQTPGPSKDNQNWSIATPKGYTLTSSHLQMSTLTNTNPQPSTLTNTNTSATVESQASSSDRAQPLERTLTASTVAYRDREPAAMAPTVEAVPGPKPLAAQPEGLPPRPKPFAVFSEAVNSPDSGPSSRPKVHKYVPNNLPPDQDSDDDSDNDNNDSPGSPTHAPSYSHGDASYMASFGSVSDVASPRFQSTSSAHMASPLSVVSSRLTLSMQSLMSSRQGTVPQSPMGWQNNHTTSSRLMPTTSQTTVRASSNSIRQPPPALSVVRPDATPRPNTTDSNTGWLRGVMRSAGSPMTGGTAASQYMNSSPYFVGSDAQPFASARSSYFVGNDIQPFAVARQLDPVQDYWFDPGSPQSPGS